MLGDGRGPEVERGLTPAFTWLIDALAMPSAKASDKLLTVMRIFLMQPPRVSPGQGAPCSFRPRRATAR